MSIIITREGRDARKIEPISIPKEDYLQQYIQTNPESLPMEDIQEDLRLLVAAREFPVASGSIDILGIDQDGNLYIIETKLFKNPDKRQVIAQVLDYGASLWSTYQSSGNFHKDLIDHADRSTDQSLVEKVQSQLGLDDSHVELLLESLDLNVSQGSFSFVVLMDRIEDRLKDLIAFVNENSRFTVYGVELKFYRFEEYEIVIPRLYGSEVRKEVAGGSQRRTWNEKSYFEDASSKLDPRAVEAIRKLYSFSRETADRITWGTGITKGSFNPRFDHIGRASLISVFSDGSLSLNFSWLKETEGGRIVAEQLGNGIQTELGIQLPQDYQTSYPQLRPEEWCPKVDKFIGLLKKVTQIK